MQIKEVTYKDVILNKEDVYSMISNYIEDRGLKFKNLEIIKTEWDVYDLDLNELKVRINQ